MPDAGVRVALLARAGDARDQLRNALSEAGADVVAEGDPAELDPGTVASRQPGVVVVSLEPAIEDALAEFDDLLAMPGVQVIYDDAEVTRQLDGWDLARWARHFAAKLAGSAVVLPPPPADAELVPDAEPTLTDAGAPPTPAQEMDHHRLEDYAAESLDLSEWVPSTPSLTDVAVEAPAVTVADDAAEPDLALDIDFAGLEEAMSAPLQDAPAAEAPADFSFDGETADDAPLDLGEFIDLPAGGEFASDLVLDDDGGARSAPESADAADDLGLASDDDAPLLVDFEMPDEPVSFSSFGGGEDLTLAGVDDDVAALAAQLDAFAGQATPQDMPREPDFSRADPEPVRDEVPAPAPRETAAPPAFGGFGKLELEPMDDTPVRSASEPSEFVTMDFRDLKLMGDDAPAAVAAPARAAASEPTASAAPAATGSRGALFVLAGLGGPDGVRQLLAALPPELPVPVLLYQHLDTGKHDRLVGQLSKASRLPVGLAVPGERAAAGRVAVLPPGVGIEAVDDGYAFVGGGTLASVVATLPAAQSAVLVLSGGDATVVPAVRTLQAGGGHVFAQDPATCFDGSAPEALIAAGATTAAVPDLARRITECWS